MENKPPKRNYKNCKTLGQIARLYNCDCDIIVRQLQAFPAVLLQYQITTKETKNPAKCYLSHSLIDSIFGVLGEV